MQSNLKKQFSVGATAALALGLVVGFNGCKRQPANPSQTTANQPAAAVAELEQRVIGIVAEQLGLKAAKLKLSDRFIADLKADSLDAVELIMNIEEKFGLEIADKDAEKMRTIGDMVEYLKSQGK